VSRQMLQPYLATRRGGAARREEQDQHAIGDCTGASRAMYRGNEEKRHDGQEKAALHETERAGLEALCVLQIEAIAQQHPANRGPWRISASPGKLHCLHLKADFAT